MSLCLQESSSCRKPRLSIVHCCLLHRLAIFYRPLPWARTYCWVLPCAHVTGVFFILGLGGMRYEETGLQHPPFYSAHFVPPTKCAPSSSAPPPLTPFSSQGCAVVIGRFTGCLSDNVDASELHILYNSAHARLSVSKGADTEFLSCGLGPARSGVRFRIQFRRSLRQ